MQGLIYSKNNGSKLHKKYSITVKRHLLFFGIYISIFMLATSLSAQNNSTIRKIVIDAGHGGKDPGAIGSSSKEKDIVLSIALKAGKYIQEHHKDVEVIYTRKTDEFIELHRRAQIANESGADLFISIHCNANKSSKPFGTETYVMGLHKSEDNLDVAKTENAAIFHEDDYAEQYEGFNPNSDEDYIVLSMFQSSSIDQSIDLSQKVQSQFKIKASRKDRGVKQAGFWVLYKTTMPGILIEAGFLSNPTEEKYLKSEDGQIVLALAIYEAFTEFKNEYEEINSALADLSQLNQPEDKVFYRIQFASYKKEKTLDFRKFRGLEEIKMYEHNGLFKYTTGNKTNLDDAIALKQKLKKQGYSDIFIVAFYQEQRISIDEAKSISKQLVP